MHACTPSNGVVETGKSLEFKGSLGSTWSPSPLEIVQTLSQNNKPEAFLPLTNSHI